MCKEADDVNRNQGYTAAHMLDWSNRVMNSLTTFRVTTEQKMGRPLEIIELRRLGRVSTVSTTAARELRGGRQNSDRSHHFHVDLWDIAKRGYVMFLQRSLILVVGCSQCCGGTARWASRGSDVEPGKRPAFPDSVERPCSSRRRVGWGGSSSYSTFM